MDISVLSVLESSLASVKPDQKYIPWKNKIKEAPNVSILRKETIQETVNPRKISQGGSLMHPENKVQTKLLDYFDVNKIMKVIPMKIIIILVIHNMTMMIL